MLFSIVACVIIFVGSTQSANGLSVISRSEWGARSPSEALESFDGNPLRYVVIHHSATGGCTVRAICQAKIRSIQNYHIDEKKWSDIAYNFIVGEDGNVYEGRGWDKKGAHARSYNPKSIGICVLGDFTNKTPSAAATKAISELLSQGVSQGKLSSDYKLVGHRQVVSTVCPGQSFYETLKDWPHWSSSP